MPASVKSSSSSECGVRPSTMCASGTPSNARRHDSSFGIIPPVTSPASMRCLASSVESTATTWPSTPSTPATSVSRIILAARSDHRDVTAPKQRRDRLSIDLGHAADETHVRTERLGDDARAVLPAQADRLAAEPVDGAHDVGIHFPGEHHLHDFHRLVVRDAQPVLELCLQAEALAHRRDLWSATVYEHGLHADVTEQHDVEQRLVPRLLERVAADLDHDDLAVESLDVWQRLDQDLRSLIDRQCHVVYSAFIRTYSSDRSQPQASAWPPARPNDATISISGCSNTRLTAARSTSTPAPRSKTTRPPMLRCSLSSASSAPL